MLALVGVGSGTCLAAALPDPPFLNGGSIPPDATTATVEAGVATFALVQEARAMQACVVTLMKRLTSANVAGDAGAAAAAESLYTVCLSAVFATARAYPLAGVPPACLDRQAVSGILSNYLNLALAHLFCDGPDVVHGLFHVPADRAALKRGTTVARIAGRFAARHAKCALGYAHGVFQAANDAAALDAAKQSYDQCYVGGRFKAEQSLSRLDGRSSGPSCLSEASLLNDQVQVLARVSVVTFCAP